VSQIRITNRLPQFIGGVQRKLARGMTVALVQGAQEASAITPIDTSVLINSQYKDVNPEGSKIVGTVGYTAEYAAAVHDPENPQNFRRAAAEKEFLRKGFERAEPAIRQIITGAIKV
jgi:hypothetical protein